MKGKILIFLKTDKIREEHDEQFGLRPIKPISAALLSYKSALLELLINHISVLIQTPSLRTSVY